MQTRKALQHVLRVYVLDTSAIGDPRLREALEAGSSNEAILLLAKLISTARINYHLEVYMPPSVYEEARRFLLANNVTPQAFEQLATWITVKPPIRHSINVPATILREIVDIYRSRITRGLKVAEDYVRKAFELALSSARTEEGREALVEKLGSLIRGLRERYREVTRHGVVDSVEDVDAVLLAYEMKGVLVTNDEGVKRLAETLGVVVTSPRRFILMLRELLAHSRG